MTNQAIHFGTSGWRGVIADDFTFGGVRRASAAVAEHVLAQTKSPTLVVGYDTRFFSPEFARTSAEVLKAHGCRILFCQEPTPTPVIAHAIIFNKLAGGVNITASHNPWDYNGLKYSGPEGGPAAVETTKDIEKRAAALPEDNTPYHEVTDKFEAIHPREAYFAQLKKMIRFDVLAKAKGNFVCDAVHGCGAGWLDRILKEDGLAITEIRATRDVLFEGKGPDPSEENLGLLKKTVLEKKALAGLATDGDADRFGILDRDGTFIDPNHILGLAFDYLLETRGYKLGAARSVATSHLLDGVAKLYGVQIYESPVGIQVRWAVFARRQNCDWRRRKCGHDDSRAPAGERRDPGVPAGGGNDCCAADFPARSASGFISQSGTRILAGAREPAAFRGRAQKAGGAFES